MAKVKELKNGDMVRIKFKAICECPKQTKFVTDYTSSRRNYNRNHLSLLKTALETNPKRLAEVNVSSSYIQPCEHSEYGQIVSISIKDEDFDFSFYVPREWIMPDGANAREAKDNYGVIFRLKNGGAYEI